MKLYYLCNKITKKFRSLQELTDELDGLMDLTDNIFENSSVTLIRTCGTRWIGHLVKELQRAVNIFEVYYAKTSVKREKSENKDKMFWQCQQMATISIPTWDGVLFAPVNADPTNDVQLGQQKEIVPAVDQEMRLEKTLKDLAMLKTICVNVKILEILYVKTLPYLKCNR